MHPLNTTPEKVAILALGRSKADWISLMINEAREGPLVDEVWGINAAFEAFQVDKIFHMDDLRVVAKEHPRYGTDLMKTRVPIVTSVAYPEFPASVAFPLKTVIDLVQEDYMNSTVAFAMAFAVAKGVKEVFLFGCDFSYPDPYRAERGGACAEFWLGYMKAKGVIVHVPLSSELLDASYMEIVDGVPTRKFYGYEEQPNLGSGAEEVKVVEVKDKPPLSAKSALVKAKKKKKKK